MPAENLTRQEAADRAALVRVHEYEIDLDLASDTTTFPTRTRVRFDARVEGAETFVDFIGESVERIELNGRELDPAEHYAEARIRLPELAAENDLVVEATARYTNTGVGLHRFTDPVDQQTYVYSQFEPADTRRVFAVFEQPDLKGTFRFTVTAPADWQVVSTQPTPEPEAGGERDGREIATWRFEPSPVLPPYVTAIIAGPYAQVSDELTSRDGRVIPLRLLARRSLMEYVDADNLFDITKRGFEFFEAEFDRAYPFDKYDQIFTPEYNMGAMENVGAVTYNEIYVFRGRVTQAHEERRALTMLHELAHMWFGNLVTMRWWDDLWLNESFAEWASTAAQTEATHWTNAWTTFAAGEKAWAYDQDQRSTTHPVVAPIRDLHDVFVNFDGITYAKGASVLKQLVAYVGREAFTTALRSYFDAYAYGNTTLADLLAELETASGKPLAAWSTAWLETAGVNTLRPEVDLRHPGEADAGEPGRPVLSEVRVVQTAAADHPTIRPHRIGVGLYDFVAGPGGSRVLQRRQLVTVDVAGKATVLHTLAGLPRPDVLLLNDDDLGYAKVRLDEQSLATVLEHPHALQDHLPRAVVLGALWDMTRDAELPARTFLRYALDVLGDSLESGQRRTLIAQVTTAARTYVAPEARVQVAIDVADRFIDLAGSAVPGSDAQLQNVTAAASWAHTADQFAWVRSLLCGSSLLAGLEIDTEMRWTLLTSLAAGGTADAAEIDAELRRDPTATGHERAARAHAAVPTAEAKARAWADGVERDDLPNATVEALAQGFVRVTDPALLEPYVTRYHEKILKVAGSRTHTVAERILEAFYPSVLASPTLLDATRTWLADHTRPDGEQDGGQDSVESEEKDGAETADEGQAPDWVVRVITERADTVQRALAAQRCDGEARGRVS